MSQTATTNETNIGTPKAVPDPGWNDPPVFSYDATQAVVQSGKKSVFLNKRVAYPLNSKQNLSEAATTDKVAQGLPPMPPVIPVTAPPPSPSVKCEQSFSTSDISSLEAADESINLEEQEMLSSVIASFDEVLSSASGESERSKEEIRKRVDVLRKMWEEDKLNSDVCKRVYRLSNALKEGDTKHADNIQAGLMVDHITLCRNWMAALRKLIHLVKVKTPPMAETE